jgi:hypothetical protein
MSVLPESHSERLREDASGDVYPRDEETVGVVVPTSSDGRRVPDVHLGVEWVEDAFSEEAMDAAWQSAVQDMTDEDLEAALNAIEEAMVEWSMLSPEEQERIWVESLDEWLKWEETVDDYGNPLDPQETTR